MIPYPDKRNRTAIQPLSFEFNKLLLEAETLESSVQENQKNLLEKKKALASLEQDYSKQLNEQLIKFQSQSSGSTLDTSGLSKFASDYEQKKAAILAEIEEITAKQNELTSSGSKNLQDKIQQYNSKTLDPVKKEDGINLYISLLLGLL